MFLNINLYLPFIIIAVNQYQLYRVSKWYLFFYFNQYGESWFL